MLLEFTNLVGIAFIAIIMYLMWNAAKRRRIVLGIDDPKEEHYRIASSRNIPLDDAKAFSESIVHFFGLDAARSALTLSDENQLNLRFSRTNLGPATTVGGQPLYEISMRFRVNHKKSPNLENKVAQFLSDYAIPKSSHRDLPNFRNPKAESLLTYTMTTTVSELTILCEKILREIYGLDGKQEILFTYLTSQ